jgi:hypothetical protein
VLCVLDNFAAQNTQHRPYYEVKRPGEKITKLAV